MLAPELPRELDTISAAAARRAATRSSRGCAPSGSARGAGRGALVTLLGARGMGSSRLAAEIAGEAHREGATVLYVAGTGSGRGGRGSGGAGARLAAADAARDR